MATLPCCHSQGVGRFVCAQAGCTDCLETLLRENKGLIQSVIQTQGMGGIDYADLVQEGRIGLWLAILHYDPARGYAFSTHAWTAIRYRLWRGQFYADRVEDDKNGAAEAWLELRMRLKKTGGSGVAARRPSPSEGEALTVLRAPAPLGCSANHKMGEGLLCQ